eukprot:gene8252-8336_t
MQRRAVFARLARMNSPSHMSDLPAKPRAASDATPMIAQFLDIKAAHPDSLLFYRMGDFYELFFNDAEIASKALGIVLTKRGKYNGEDIPMCGVPVVRSEDYLQRLIGLGHRVAVCEQVEDPAEAKKRGAKSVVRRDVIRLVTPGTITEEQLLDPVRPSLFLALARQRQPDESWSYGLAAVDISTGAFLVAEADEVTLAGEIFRIDPREIIVTESLGQDKGLKAQLADLSVPVTIVAASGEFGQAERHLCAYFGVATLDGFGALSRAEINASALALHYVEKTQIGSRPMLAPPQRARSSAFLAIDAATRGSLELMRTLSGERNGSLLAALDMTMTPAGGRLLAERLAGPVMDVSVIAARQEALAWFLEDSLLRADIRVLLKRMPDTIRALSRLALERGGPRDLAALRDGLMVARSLAERVARIDSLPDEIANAMQACQAVPAALGDHLARLLGPDMPLNKRDGNFIAAGFDPMLDESRALRDESRKVIAEMQATYAQLCDSRQVRIKYNNFLGYYVEVPQVLGEVMLQPPLNATFIHRQTMSDAMRFSTPALAELEARIASAADRALTLELQHFDSAVASVLAQGHGLRAAHDALAVLDVGAALAELAAQRNWVRPLVNNSTDFHIVGGRHPVVEAALRQRGSAFVANGCALSGPAGNVLALITGPNMAGKSTYLRQNALMVILAQMGSFVPAERAEIGIVDRLFSRVGASDDLARGRSTFMVEMVETAAILNQATAQSLVILDEIGRGTATYDGLSIAWACLDHLHDINRCRTLFATHFHELTRLSPQMPRLANLTMRVTEWNGDVVFLHEVIEGAANRSYGIQVAKLAGLPKTVIDRASLLLAELESGEHGPKMDDLMEDLPLFAQAPVALGPAAKGPDPLYEALRNLNPDELTPREALESLYGLKKIL